MVKIKDLKLHQTVFYDQKDYTILFLDYNQDKVLLKSPRCLSCFTLDVSDLSLFRLSSTVTKYINLYLDRNGILHTITSPLFKDMKSAEDYAKTLESINNLTYLRTIPIEFEEEWK
jgi:hypothetical protein